LTSVYGQNLDYSLKPVKDISYNQLKKGFENPPNEAKVRAYWWWLNGMATKASITRDLSEMEAKGYGGAIIMDAGSSNYAIASKTPHGPDFASPQWRDLLAHTVKVADSLGLEISLNIQSGWNPGGPSVKPKDALKKIVFKDTMVEGPKTIHVALPHPETGLYYKDILVQAYPESKEDHNTISNWGVKSMNGSFGMGGIFPLYKLQESSSLGKSGIPVAEVKDISKFYKNDTLSWKVPPGKWHIARYGMTTTGAKVSTGSDGWSGLSYDHLNKAAFKKYFDKVVQPLINTAKDAGNSLKFLHTDSWEMGAVNWTANFRKDFKKLRGYDLEPYLPVLQNKIVQNLQISDRFLNDFRRTIGDLVYKNQYAYFAKLAHKNNLYIHPESGGPHSAPVDALEIMGNNDIPMGEYWARANTHRVKESARLSVKQGASAAHIYGKRFMFAEGPTSIGPQWERSPNDLKGVLDRVMCAGVNRFAWHTFTSSPKKFGVPGNEYFAGTHLNPNTTWWDEAGTFINYLNRSSYLLSLGLFQADVLYYYGDDVPNFVFLKNEMKKLEYGYDWDKCNTQVLLQRASVTDHKLTLPDGMQYSVLVLPDKESIRLKVLKKIEKLVRAGLTVIGPKPKRAKGLNNYPESDKEVTKIADRLWGEIEENESGEHQVGLGKVVYGKSVNKVLQEMGRLPDFGFKSAQPNAQLDYIHRKTDSADIYFVVNRLSRKGIFDFEYRYDPTLPDRYDQVDLEFRVKNGIPEIWDPLKGTIRQPLLYRHEDGKTIVSMHLEPEGSAFVVFNKNDNKTSVTGLEKDGVSVFPVTKNSKAGNYPLVKMQEENSDLKTEWFGPGKYTLKMSNGESKSVQIKPFDTIVPISKTWKVTFDPMGGEPIQRKLKKLISWTDFPNPEIKYYSGKATYTTSFKLSRKKIKNYGLYLDLGNMQDVAVVYVNGKKVRTVWKAPYRINVTNYVDSGDNTLKIEVINLWPNRLIGDGKLPKEKRHTQTNINKFDQPGAEKYLRISGLLGPVTIRLAKKETL
jgi:hypothetical protein